MMNSSPPNPSRDNARKLRQTTTSPEELLWSVLRGRRLDDHKFRRQQPIDPFIADFACLAIKLVVELDGDYHDYVVEADLRRQAFLETEGFSVIRFSNQDVLNDLPAVVEGIRQAAQVILRELDKSE